MLPCLATALLGAHHCSRYVARCCTLQKQLSNLTERLLVCHCFHWSDPSAVFTSQTCFTSNGMPHMTAALALGNAQSISAVLHMSFQRATAKADVNAQSVWLCSYRCSVIASVYIAVLQNETTLSKGCCLKQGSRSRYLPSGSSAINVGALLGTLPNAHSYLKP